MNEHDLRLTILGCFRYSLGRMTYMPSHTVKIIKENAAIFNEWDWRRIILEIKEAPSLGMSCDKSAWEELRQFAEEQIK